MPHLDGLSPLTCRTAEAPYPLVDAPRARVHKSFTPSSSERESKLALAVNEVVYVLEQSSSGWWGGHKDNEDVTGWFPSACVRLIEDDDGGQDEMCQCGSSTHPLHRDQRGVASPMAANDPRRRGQEVALQEAQRAAQLYEEQLRRSRAELSELEAERLSWKQREQDLLREQRIMRQELQQKDDRITALEVVARASRPVTPGRMASSPPIMEPGPRAMVPQRSVSREAPGISIAVAAAVAAAAQSATAVPTTPLTAEAHRHATSSLSRSKTESCAFGAQSMPPTTTLGATGVPAVASMATSPVPAVLSLSAHAHPLSARHGGGGSATLAMPALGSMQPSSGSQSARSFIVQAATSSRPPSPRPMAFVSGVIGRNESPVRRGPPPLANDTPVRALVSTFERAVTPAPVGLPAWASPARHGHGASSSYGPPLPRVGSVTRMGSGDIRACGATRSTDRIQIAVAASGEAPSSVRALSVKDRIRQLNQYGY